MIKNKILRILLILFSIILCVALVIFLIYYPTFKFMTGNRLATVIDDRLTIHTGSGCSSGVLVSDSAVLVIDTKMGKAAVRLYEEVSQLAEGKKVIVVNTHSDFDHTMGNRLYKGATIIASHYPDKYWLVNNGPEAIPSVWVDDTMTLKLGDETVSLMCMGQAHTWNDMVVYLHNRKVLFTGDLVFNGSNPFLGKEKGSSAEGYIRALSKLQELDGIITVVPGHGVVGGKELIQQMSKYFEDMTMAAKNPGMEHEMKRKYCHRMTTPMVSSPAITIQYIREEGE